MSTSVEQVSRLLALVPYLQAHPDADLAETAAAFGVTPRRLLADLEVLWFVGLPGGLPGDLIDIDMDAVQSHGRIRLTNAEYLSRPMRFTIDEVTSLIVALRAVREVAGGEAGDAVDSALAKLSTVAGAQESRRVEFAVATSEGGVRDRLAAAIADGAAVRLTYDGLTRAETTRPVVEPHRLTVRDGFVYLEAWSRDRSDWRTFRLDRVTAVDDADGGVADHGEPPVRRGLARGAGRSRSGQHHGHRPRPLDRGVLPGAIDHRSPWGLADRAAGGRPGVASGVAAAPRPRRAGGRPAHGGRFGTGGGVRGLGAVPGAPDRVAGPREGLQPEGDGSPTGEGTVLQPAKGTVLQPAGDGSPTGWGTVLQTS